MPLRTPCPTTDTENETARWLCVPGNRALSTFLDSVHTWYHEHNNRLTESQVQGVERWRERHAPNNLATPRVESLSEVRRLWGEWLEQNEDEDLSAAELDGLRVRFYQRRGWQMDDDGLWEPVPSAIAEAVPDDDPDDVDGPRGDNPWRQDPFSGDDTPSFITQMGGIDRVVVTPAQAAALADSLGLESYGDDPATANFSHTILNGHYEISSDASSTMHRYRIFTITYSRNNPGLVGKRVVAWWNGEAWESFAFMTRGGALKVWRRFEARSSEGFVVYARMLLRALNQFSVRVDINQGSERFGYEDELQVRWTVFVTSTLCRLCNTILHTQAHRELGVDSCDTTATGTPPAAVRITSAPRAPRQPRSEYRRNNPTVARVPVEVHTMSEVSGTWEQ